MMVRLWRGEGKDFVGAERKGWHRRINLEKLPTICVVDSRAGRDTGYEMYASKTRKLQKKKAWAGVNNSLYFDTWVQVIFAFIG